MISEYDLKQGHNIHLMVHSPRMKVGDTVRIRGGVHKGHSAIVRAMHPAMVTVAIRELGERRIFQSSCKVVPKQPDVSASVKPHMPRRPKSRMTPPATASMCEGRTPMSILVELLDALVIQRSGSESVPYSEWVSVRDRVDALYNEHLPVTGAPGR